ncbi:hypothetical protein BB934_45795 (plasmid) [Microvirga ossetica]|uniref:Uncharacterized protein n=2 Tax=Microvirga ossetica TaxID=1882682 RepID=A0A1B2EZW5_9HYPH|nr:hypothetical protein BB934_45795 [Microvirga ossetica]
MSCTTTPYSLTTNPDKIVTFAPDVAATWPGALMQGAGLSLGLGSFRELPIKKRAPIHLSVDLLASPNTKTVVNPSASTIRSAISDLIVPLQGKEDFGGSIAFSMSETFSLEQSLLEVGLSAKYAGSEFKAKHRAQTSREKRVLTASLIQKCFTIYIDTPQTPGALFSDDFTLEDLAEQEALGRLGKDNLPALLSSVTYGRMLYVTISSSKSFDEVKSALSASYGAGKTGAKAEYDAESRKTLNESEMRITGTGIEEENAKALILSGNVADYFSNDMDIRSVVPISFLFLNIRDLSIAAIADTAHYNITVCVPKRVDKPSDGIAQRAASLESRLQQFRDSWVNAAGNSSDFNGRREHKSQGHAHHAAISENIEWLRTHAKELAPDDRVWLLDWMPGIQATIERQWNEFRVGYETNTSDKGTQAICLNAMDLLDSQRSQAVAARNAIADRTT